MPFVYILQCNDSSFYTGAAKDLDQRVAAHNSGKAAKYTRSRLPVRLVYFEKAETMSDALKREYQIKQLQRDEKEKLIQDADLADLSQ